MKNTDKALSLRMINYGTEVSMFFKQVKTPGIAHNAYLIGTEGIGILVNPRRE